MTKGYKTRMVVELIKKEPNLTHQQVADRLHVSKNTVSYGFKLAGISRRHIVRKTGDQKHKRDLSKNEHTAFVDYSAPDFHEPEMPPHIPENAPLDQLCAPISAKVVSKSRAVLRHTFGHGNGNVFG